MVQKEGRLTDFLCVPVTSLASRAFSCTGLFFFGDLKGMGYSNDVLVFLCRLECRVKMVQFVGVNHR
jgi:hypothetical protein